MFEGFWSTKGRDDNNRFTAWLAISFVISLLTGHVPGLSLVGALASMWISWTAAVRRGHDMGRSAPFTLIVFVLPTLLAMGVFVFAIFALFSGAGGGILLSSAVTGFLLIFGPSAWYMCARGEVGENDHGPDPRSPERIRADPDRRSDAVLSVWIAGISSVLVIAGLVLVFSMMG